MTRIDYCWLPKTNRGKRYREQCYWFATGWWFAQDRAEFVPDFSDDFSRYGAYLADEYETEQRSSLPSIPDMWKEYLNELDQLAHP
jgi:hypothetical protein